MSYISPFITFCKTRNRYGSGKSFLCAVYNRILRRNKFPLPLRGTCVNVYLKGDPNPFIVRLGTTDLHVLEEIYFNGEYDGIIPLLGNNLRLIVDLGSNIGISVRYWNSHFPSSNIIAIEPDSENAGICMQNVKSVGISDQVILKVACIGSHARTVNLANSDDGEWALHMEEVSKFSNRKVNCITMESVLENIPNSEQIDILKCDIEGAEQELFKSCATWINRINNIIIELHPPYSVPAFIKDYKNNGGKLNIVYESKEKYRPLVILR